MMRRVLVPMVAVALLLVVALAGSRRVEVEAEPAAPAVEREPLPPGARVETVFSQVRNPVAMAFAPDGRWFFTERTTGWVQLVSGSTRSGVYQAPAVGGLNDERGLLGIALDPNFAANGYVYIFYTGTTGGSQIENRVERFTLQGTLGVSTTRLLTLPFENDQVQIHNGGNLHFGPDGKLYVSIGDNFDAANAQDLARLQGKLHRFEPSAPLTAPASNPLHDGPGPNADSIFAYGFRNPFDFDFDPVSGVLFAGDNGIACDDELNRVLPGYNYGWRINYPPCDDASPGGPDPAFNTIPPFIHWPYSAVPTGVAFYDGDLFPEWKNDLFVCHWKDGSLNHFKLNGARDAIVAHTVVDGVTCHVDVETGLNGAFYFFRNDDDDPSKEHRFIQRITRDATLYASTFAPSTSIPAAGEALTYTMRLVHYGTLTTTFAVTSSLPPSTTLVAGSLQSTGGAIDGSSAGIEWIGSILPNSTLIATYRVLVDGQIAAPTWLANEMVVASPEAGLLQLPALVVVNGHSVYLPVVVRGWMP